MKFTILFAFLILCIGFPKAQSLQCYVCQDCEDISDQELQTCSLEIPTTETPETEAPETEAPDTEAPDTEAPDTEAPDTEEPDTEAPDTEEPDTEAPDTEAPDTEAPDTEAPDTEAPDTEAPDTEAPDTEAPDTEAPDTEAPDTEAPDTEAPDTEAPDTEAPDTEAPDTEAPDTEAPDTNVPEETYNIKKSEQGNVRRKRHITRTKPLIFNGCYCIDEDNCDCSNKLSQRSDDASAIEMVCYKALINIESTSSATVVRGCAPAQVLGQPFCEFSNSLVSDMVSCTTCNTDGCNAALNVRESVFLIIVSVTALWYNKYY